LYTLISDKVVSPNIAFHAKNVKNNNPVAGNTIVFTDIILNLDDSYNSDTGVFTVSLGGIYLFTVQFFLKIKVNVLIMDWSLMVLIAMQQYTRTAMVVMYPATG
jgi:hypothetical protein